MASNVPTLNVILMADDSDDVKIAKLAKLADLYPLLRRIQRTSTSPTAMPVPFHVDVIKTIRRCNPSIDLYDQYDLETGKPVAHFPEYCREVPTWLQKCKWSVVRSPSDPHCRDGHDSRQCHQEQSERRTPS